MQLHANEDPDHPEALAAGVHTVVWSVPYFSDCNPIEVVWSRAKGHVAKTNGATATLDSVRNAMRDGLNGIVSDTDHCPGVTAGFCSRIVGHLHNLVNRWVRQSPLLCKILGEKDKVIESIDATAIQAYGPIALAHRVIRQKRKPKPAAAPVAAVDEEEIEEVDGEDDEQYDPADALGEANDNTSDRVALLD